VYIAGFWDRLLEYRGVAFAPVRFLRPVYQQPYYYYRPSYRIIANVDIFAHLFIRPGRSQYYFGDWYGDQYATHDYRPWVDYSIRQGGHDSLYNYYRSSRTPYGNTTVIQFAFSQNRLAQNNTVYRPQHAYRAGPHADSSHDNVDHQRKISSNSGVQLVDEQISRRKGEASQSAKDMLANRQAKNVLPGGRVRESKPDFKLTLPKSNNPVLKKAEPNSVARSRGNDSGAKPTRSKEPIVQENPGTKNSERNPNSLADPRVRPKVSPRIPQERNVLRNPNETPKLIPPKSQPLPREPAPLEQKARSRSAERNTHNDSTLQNQLPKPPQLSRQKPVQQPRVELPRKANFQTLRQSQPQRRMEQAPAKLNQQPRREQNQISNSRGSSSPPNRGSGSKSGDRPKKK
jgi:hypothetical protein